MADGTERPGRTRPASHRAGACPRAVRRARAAAAASLLPGLGHLVAGRLRAGLAVLTVTVGVLAATLLAALALGPSGLAHLAVRPGFLTAVAAALCAASLAWCLAIVSAYRAARPERMSRRQAGVSGAVVGALCLGALAPAAWGVQSTSAARRVIHTTFAGDGRTLEEPDVIDSPELNILLLGGDGGPNRRGVRTDAIVLANIDTRTGRTRLVSLPRNLQHVPMRPGTPLARAYPDGFDDYWFSVYEVAQAKPSLVPDARPRYAGAAAFSDLVEYTTGVPIDYYVVADLAGFRRLIDSLGGVEIDVRTGDGRPLPIGGAHADDGSVLERPTGRIPLGVQHLDGYHALWYSRSRFNSGDDERQVRQRCLLTALARQASPARVLRDVARLAEATESALITNIPADALPELADLARRTARSATVTGHSVADAAGSSRHPDLRALRARVRAVLATPDEKPAGPVPVRDRTGERLDLCP